VIDVDIPSFGKLCLEHLVLDYNGTLAQDGDLLPGVREALSVLAERLTLHVLTGDTFGKARHELEGLPCLCVILAPEEQAQAKADYVERIGTARAVCIGNGRNDRLMLQKAALGIAVIQGEGAATESLLAARIVCRDVPEALNFLLSPLRLTATMRG
jgi:P-type E1-E2 ATPase